MYRLRLEDICNINQGIPLTRIRIGKYREKEERTVYSFESESKITVPKNIEDIEQKIPLIEEDMILVNLTSYKAAKAVKDDVGKVIPSNYIIIEVKNKTKINPDYLAWYIDQSQDFKRELHRIKQGSTIMSIPINEFRKIRINLPSLEFQNNLGKIDSLSKKRKRLFLEREELIKKSLVTINEGEQ